MCYRCCIRIDNVWTCNSNDFLQSEMDFLLVCICWLIDQNINNAPLLGEVSFALKCLGVDVRSSLPTNKAEGTVALFQSYLQNNIFESREGALYVCLGDMCIPPVDKSPFSFIFE